MIVIYINENVRRARVHEENCSRVLQNKGGYNGYYKYFECYEDAWDYVNEELNDYDCENCYYCNPENENCE